MLPRQEFRKSEEALEWLRKSSSELIAKLPGDKFAFIFHNFVPAISSAFCLARPGERKVAIEALWGIPEGLYYNSHDKIIVDTLHSDLQRALGLAPKFSIEYKARYKGYCVAQQDSGRWGVERIGQPHDWARALSNDDWIRGIALGSRKIAESEEKSVSVMWFAGTWLKKDADSLLAWFHEPYDVASLEASRVRRSKTPFDRTISIRTAADVFALKKAVEGNDRTLRRIEICPSDEALLREKDTLRDIGDLAKEIDAEIVLEGATLSHAYYQLRQTGAIVCAVDGFGTGLETQEFNKLVRDKVPEKIRAGGEDVAFAKLQGSSLISALREKLVEEAFEALDARSDADLIEELSDILQVSLALCSRLGISLDELIKKSDEKRNMLGGFDSGLVLLETRNPLLIGQEDVGQVDLLGGVGRGGGVGSENVKTAPIIGRGLQKWVDRRHHESATESILKITVPVALGSWEQGAYHTHRKEPIQLTVKGRRLHSNLEIEVSLFDPPKQLGLLADDVDPRVE